MADISKIKLNGVVYNIKDASAQTAFNTTLPAIIAEKFGGVSYDPSTGHVNFFPDTDKVAAQLLDYVDLSEMSFSEINLTNSELQDSISLSLQSVDASGATACLDLSTSTANVILPLVNGAEVLTDASGFGKVYYNSTTQKIEFYRGDAEFSQEVPTAQAASSFKICELDATAFIKDGMVSDVRLENVATHFGGPATPHLVIEWNTDAGKQDINIPLSSIFNPDNYIDKDHSITLVGFDTTTGEFTYTVGTNSPTSYLTLDSSPTSGSKKPVTSGGIYTALSGKQDTLVSGTNIKTIDGSTILTSGNIDTQRVLYGKLEGTPLTFKKGSYNNSAWTYSSSTTAGQIDKVYVDVSITPHKAYCWDGTGFKELSVTVDSTWVANSTNPAESQLIQSALSNKLDTYSANNSAWDTTPQSGSTKPITSGGVYQTLDSLTNSFNSAIGGALTDVSYNSSTRLLSKTVGAGSPTGIVYLPTANYISASETLEITLASVPS